MQEKMKTLFCANSSVHHCRWELEETCKQRLVAPIN